MILPIPKAALIIDVATALFVWPATLLEIHPNWIGTSAKQETVKYMPASNPDLFVSGRYAIKPEPKTASDVANRIAIQRWPKYLMP